MYECCVYGVQRPSLFGSKDLVKKSPFHLRGCMERELPPTRKAFLCIFVLLNIIYNIDCYVYADVEIHD